MCVDPASLHRYTYANNNPLRYVDPDGRRALVIVGDPNAIGEPTGITTKNIDSYRRAIGEASKPYLEEKNQSQPVEVVHFDAKGRLVVDVAPKGKKLEAIDEVVWAGHAGVVEYSTPDGTVTSTVPAFLVLESRSEPGTDFVKAVDKKAPDVKHVKIVGCQSCTKVGDDDRSLAFDVRDSYREKGKDVDVRGLEIEGNIKTEFDAKNQVKKVTLRAVTEKPDGSKERRELLRSDLKTPVPPKPKVDLQGKKEDFQGPPDQQPNPR